MDPGCFPLYVAFANHLYFTGKLQALADSHALPLGLVYSTPPPPAADDGASMNSTCSFSHSNLWKSAMLYITSRRLCWPDLQWRWRWQRKQNVKM